VGKHVHTLFAGITPESKAGFEDGESPNPFFFPRSHPLCLGHPVAFRWVCGLSGFPGSKQSTVALLTLS
jgi:hypothetical protein